MQVLLDDYAWAATLATELVNTVPGVWSGVDKLPDAEALAAFLREHAPGRPELADAAARMADGPSTVAQVHAVRARVLELVAHPDVERLVTGARALTGAVGAVTLADDDSAGHDGRARWAVRSRGDSTLAERLGLVCGVGVLGALRTLGVERFRPCAAETCSGVFIDTSRPGRRRYCMPDLCGNRVNVAAHRARRAAR